MAGFRQRVVLPGAGVRHAPREAGYWIAMLAAACAILRLLVIRR